jgi:hypothetical protein
VRFVIETRTGGVLSDYTMFKVLRVKIFAEMVKVSPVFTHRDPWKPGH